MNTSPQPPKAKPSFSIVRVLLVLIPALLIAGTWYVAKTYENKALGNDPKLMERMGFKPPVAQQLDERFTDANDDLVADAPADASQQVSPDKLFFSYIGGTEAEAERAAWEGFVEHLSKRIGKPVELVTYEDTDKQLEALEDGKLHITGFNTGSVPLAVNTCGFVPVCVPGKADGTFGYKMQFIVPASSSVAKLTDLKDKKITFIDTKSHSGYKAAAVALKAVGLLPGRDYQWGLSTSHDESIKGIAEKQFQAAPVASNLLQRAEAEGTIRADQYKKIYESELFPPAALGYVYNLSPELSEKVRAALLDYSFAGTGLEKLLARSGDIKFVSVNYKDNFAIVRSIDASLGEGIAADGKK